MAGCSNGKTQSKYGVGLLWQICLLAAVICTSSHADGKTKPKLPPDHQYKLIWQKVVIARGQVIQVGAWRLPYPIILPKSVIPLGDMAMVRLGHEPNFIMGFELYFSVKNDKPLRHWAENSASHFPISLGKYKILQEPNLHVTHDSWLYRIVVQGKDARVLLVVSRYPFRPSVDKLNPDPMEDGWTSSESPIKNVSSFIGVRIYYGRVK